MENIAIYWTEYREVELTKSKVFGINKQLSSQFQIDIDTASLTKKISLYSKIKLSEILSRDYDLPNGLVSFSKDGNGKPYLKGSNINFNISHSKNIIAYAICNKAEVGIDIQYQKDVKTPLAKKVLCPDEFSSFEAHENPSSHFIQLWTRKEAVVKCTGKGIKTGFSTFSVLTDTVVLSDETVYVQDVNILDGFKCTIASIDAVSSVTVKKL